jgi:uncharacterized repeat protein (TIGR01451 family)
MSIESLFAQEVIVNIQHPPFNQLHIEDLWNLTILNTGTLTLDVHLQGTLSEQQAGIIVNAESKPFQLLPGTKIFNASNYNELGISILYPNPDPSFEESIRRTGGCPSGNYEICIKIINNGSRELLGENCIQQTVMMTNPPSIISPEDGSEITVKYPGFMWTPVSGVQGIQYKFRIVKVFGSQSLYEAIQSNDVLYSETTSRTTIIYPPSAPELVDGERYAWQVQSLDVNGIPVGLNNGLSEAAGFSFIGLSIFPAITVAQNLNYYAIEKSVNTESAKLGDELTYTIYIKKTGKTNPGNVEIKDAIPEGTELVEGSVSIEKVDEKGKSSDFGKNNYDVNTAGGDLEIKIKNFPDKHYLKITFRVKINSSPENGIISNKGLKIHIPKFKIPGGTAGPFNYDLKEGTQTTVAPDVSISKTANVTECGPGDYIEYTITIENKEDKEVEITLYDLIPDNAKFVPPVKVDGKEVKSEITEDSELNSYVKYKVKIPAKSKVTITIRYKVTGYGTITNKVYTGLPTKGAPSDDDVKSSVSIESTLETYLKNTYERELANIIEHKSTANSVHIIDDALELIEKKEKTIEFNCNGTPVKIKVKFAGWGSAPKKSDDRTQGEADASESWIFEKGELIYEVSYKIVFDLVMEYEHWRENKAVFYHELLHIQLQLENWKDEKWKEDFCKKVKEWAKTKKGDPPDVVQSEDEDHEKIGEDDKDDGWQKDFLEKLKGLKE